MDRRSRSIRFMHR